MAKEFPALMTVAEVAEALRLSDETIHRWSREGRLRYINIFGVKRFRRDYIQSILDGTVVIDERVA